MYAQCVNVPAQSALRYSFFRYSAFVFPRFTLASRPVLFVLFYSHNYLPCIYPFFFSVTISSCLHSASRLLFNSHCADTCSCLKRRFVGQTSPFACLFESSLLVYALILPQDAFSLCQYFRCPLQGSSVNRKLLQPRTCFATTRLFPMRSTGSCLTFSLLEFST